MQQCGFCSMISGLLRRAMCVGSQRGSSDSYYRELGDQDTLSVLFQKIEDKSSDFSDDAEEETSMCNGRREEASPASSRGHAAGHIETQIDVIIEPVKIPEEKFPELENMKPRNLSASRFLTMQRRRKRRLLTRTLNKEHALLDDLSAGQVQCILNQSVHWHFNAFTLENVSGGRCLPVLCIHLFQLYGLLSHFKLDAAKAWKLFTLIEEGYISTNPYHNSIHAADVTQAMHCFLQQKQIRDHLTPLEIMASLLAAIAHDMDHPGVNQPFLIATSNHLAALYRNTSVLENHHWRSAMSCLIESGILDQMPSGRTTLENQISSLILATDITRQQEYLSRFKRHLDTNTLDMKNSEHRQLVLQIALKCADISNPCRPWEISKKWSLKVCEEFFRQGDYERQLNLPVTALCDRHNTSIPKIQTGFFKFVVTPLISEWHRFLHNDLSTQMLNNLVYNQHKWEAMIHDEVNEETRTEISDADMVEDDIETLSGTNMSDSSELLLPPRRSSQPSKQNSFKEQLRRFSVPLNVFQDSKFKNKARASSLAEPRTRGHGSRTSSEHSIHSQLSARAQGESAAEPAEKVLSSENLLPESTIASITTPVQATLLNTVIKDGSWKLVRQQTFPPLETKSREHSLATRPMFTSNEDAINLSRFRPDFLRLDSGPGKKDPKFSNLYVRDTEKTETDDACRSNVETATPPQNLEKENKEPKPSRKESSTVGSQLRDNLTSMPLGLDSDPLLRRRKSMPTDVLAFSESLSPKEKKMREVPTALPQFLRRTMSGKEAWTRRRGSAPSPVAPSELRGLAALGSMRHSVNGGRRKPSPIVTCQQWLAKATYSVQERTLQQFPRRSSLPVEVMTGISSH
ncbi:uncharacterized protein LOC113504323 isoform X2 [Trichoplusia ni]|uniref:Phosphodiesterase n=1 Tax=Trichoplusia ni TaxID=7111 RepID=A0A7E5WNQ7_TRINI|nr:uncharacterized protein LOC113504323 isoform X2 [Trichoplusia ni]